VIMVCGWLPAALAGMLAVRFSLNSRVVSFRNAHSGRWDWRIAVPYFLGLVLNVFGGAGLQHRSFGLWAIPVAIVPFGLAFAVPVQLHNARLRRSQVG